MLSAHGNSLSWVKRFQEGATWRSSYACETTLKPGARALKARGGTCSPDKVTWLADCITTLVAFGLVFLDPQAMRACAAMAVPRKGAHCLVSDYRATNKQIEEVPVVMPDQEVNITCLT